MSYDQSDIDHLVSKCSSIGHHVTQMTEWGWHVSEIAAVAWRMANRGCCGSYDDLIFAQRDGGSHAVMFGFNYGH